MGFPRTAGFGDTGVHFMEGAICQVLTLCPPFGPAWYGAMVVGGWWGGRGRQHLRVWPHGWIVVDPENTNEADNTCGRGGASQEGFHPA